jgi:hypothetical protein
MNPVVLLLPMLFVGFFLHSRFLTRVRVAHPSVWVELGSPTMFLNNSIKNGLTTQAFLWHRRYRDLSDPQLSRRGDILIAFNVTYIIFFAGLVISGFLRASAP